MEVDDFLLWKLANCRPSERAFWADVIDDQSFNNIRNSDQYLTTGLLAQFLAHDLRESMMFKVFETHSLWFECPSFCDECHSNILQIESIRKVIWNDQEERCLVFNYGDEKKGYHGGEVLNFYAKEILGCYTYDGRYIRFLTRGMCCFYDYPKMRVIVKLPHAQEILMYEDI